jgi:acyl-CoA thioesterase FadM
MEATVESRAIPIEQIISLQPFIVRRRIAFRDCDPAGIVYTPRFLDPIATSAADLFIAELIGPYGNRDKEIKGLDTPAKAVNMVFHSPSRHGDLLDLEVYCSRIGTTSFETAIEARSEDGKPRFDCRITVLSVEHNPFRASPLPEYLIEKLSPHQRS